MKKNMKRVVSGVLGAASMMTVVAAQAEAAIPALQEREAETYAKVANVKGDFHFHQDALTPADEVFNLFGTVATAACAKPGFAFEGIQSEDYYVNVKGTVKKAYSLTLEQIKAKEAKEEILKCSCLSGMAIAQAGVKGVKVSDIVEMAEIEEDTNTITFKSADGYGLAMPLQYVLDKEALLVYEIGGTELSAENGGQLQVWMPDTVAKYFTRQITEIELTAEAEVPAVEGVNPEYRAKVSVLNRFDNTFAVGDQINIEGYADDCGKAIKAIEFSMDGGETWTNCETAGATGDAWVYWHFGYTAEAAGAYKLDVRAVAADGTVSPLASSVVFTVE